MKDQPTPRLIKRWEVLAAFARIQNPDTRLPIVCELHKIHEGAPVYGGLWEGRPRGGMWQIVFQIVPDPCEALRIFNTFDDFSRLDPEDRVEILEALNDTVPEPPMPKDSSFIRFEKRCQQAVPYTIAFAVLYLLAQVIRLAVVR